MTNTQWDHNATNELVKAFLDGTLSETEWTHHAHLVVCAYHLNKYEYYDASLRVKIGIIRYNEAIGLVNTIERGYHETMTLFWIWAVNEYLKRSTSSDIATIINGLLDSPFSKKYLPFFFYSEDHIFSREARVSWVAPDIKQLTGDAIVSEFPTSIWFG